MHLHSKTGILQIAQSFLDQHPEGVLEVLGPTASGKTAFAVEIAHLFAPAEIISVDSRQVFTGFDVSSAKIIDQEKQGIPHWGIDLVTPEDPFSVADFQKYAFEKIVEIQARGHRPILCGGTMLWLDAISENYIFSDSKDEKSTQKAPPRWPFLKIGIHWDRASLYERCNQRAVWMFENGLINEVQHILQKYPNMTRSARTNFGYGEVGEYLEGKISYQEALALNQKRNRNYAKRQLTWWRGREDLVWAEGSSKFS